MKTGGWDKIDRDPQEMLNYAKMLKKSIDTIESNLSLTSNKMQSYVQELDADCRDAMQRYDVSVNKLREQLRIYRDLVRMLEDNANYILNRPRI